MHTTLTSKGQVTVPKHVRDALQLLPGAAVSFAVNDAGDVVLRPASVAGLKSAKKSNVKDRFESARGIATIKWRTDTLMALLRSDD
jgi:antitoxin PrlF